MDAKQLPAHPSLEQYKKQAKDLLRAAHLAETIRRFKRYHPRFSKISETEIAAAKPSLADAQWVIAREHAFESWPRFVEHIQELTRAESGASHFELAADAIVHGDAVGLKALLQKEPGLARARSTREHNAPLIHYVAANGVEDWRQKTPKNIVEITHVLLGHGAEVDAVSLAYGGPSTALGLAATSYHPAKAGVQLELLSTLLKAGAQIDGAPGGWSPLIAALHNGRGVAAQFLANHGARLDLEGAAGTGRVELVETFVEANGTPKNDATLEQLQWGFLWACQYGHLGVVRCLIERGFKPEANSKHGQTGLHWAAFGGHLEIVDVLLKSRPPVNVKDQIHHSTPLSWAIYGWANPAPEARDARHYEVVAKLISAGATLDRDWLRSADGGAVMSRVRANPRMMAALKIDP